MSTRVAEQVDEWESRPFEGGYGELHALADEGFSGVIRAGGAELYMTKGTVVGVLDGSVEDFDVDGTAYEAPSPALPLLAVMQDQGQDARAEYYSEDTGLGEIDSKLADAGFTGYIELSENVLSGDYYVVYHRGQSMSVAFVGPESRVKTDEEALQQATDEIGIYRVHPADIDAIDIPEPEPEAAETETATAPAGGVAEMADEGGGEEAAAAGTDNETVEESEEPQAVDAAETAKTTAGADASAGASSEPTDRPAESGAGTDGVDAAGEQASASRSGESGSPEEEQTGTRTGSTATEAPSPDSGRGHLETRSIPSLDPGRTETDDSGPAVSGPGGPDPLGPREAGKTVDTGGPERDRDGRRHPRDGADHPGTSADERGDPGGQAGGDPEAERTPVDQDRIDELEAELEDREDEIDRLEEELESAAEEKDRLEEELAAVRDERDDLEDEVERLEAELDRMESELDRLESEFGAATDRERRISAGEALDGTDIFVRYRSKGDATLEDAHEGAVRQEDVVDNLVLEKHTQFDADAVSVGGQTYQEFLETRVEYQFVQWVAEELLFEIRDTGHADALRTLYDALPRIDRAELRGTVDVVYTEDGQETRSTEGFDVVYRDRMGDPLLVANINDSREAATQSMMENIVTAAERVGKSSEGFAAAFLVTESFFEPGALETASEATRGGLLSRSKYKSFVNLSRKRGYHLCLVEARSENFSLSVPEL